jgi:hypothetical protein
MDRSFEMPVLRPDGGGQSVSTNDGAIVVDSLPAGFRAVTSKYGDTFYCRACDRPVSARDQCGCGGPQLLCGHDVGTLEGLKAIDCSHSWRGVPRARRSGQERRLEATDEPRNPLYNIRITAEEL